MADYAAETVVEQCTAFLDMGDGNYLYSTFVDRVSELDGLSEQEKSDYIQENASRMEDYVYPAYQELVSAVNTWKPWKLLWERQRRRRKKRWQSQGSRMRN